MIIRHALGYTLGRLFPALASIATLIVFTRLMLPDQFGRYSLTVNLTTIAVGVLGNFLIIGLGRFEPVFDTDPDKKRFHSTIIITAIILSSALAALLGVLALLEILPKLSVDYCWFSILFPVSLLMMLSQKLINASLKPLSYGISIGIKNIVLLVGGGLLLFAGYGVSGIFLSLAVGSLLAVLPALNLWSKTRWKKFDLNMLKKLWSYGAPLTLLYLFVMVIGFSDRIFIDVMLEASDVGIYSAAYDLTQYTIAVFGSIVHLASFPVIIRAYESSGERMARLQLAVTIRILLLIMIPAAAGFIALKSEFSQIFLGSRFAEKSMMIMPVLAASVFLSTIKSYYFDYAFQITKNTGLQTLPPMIAALLNCILNYFMIPVFGVMGAAYATLVSYGLYLLLAVVLSRKVFRFPCFPWSFLLKVSIVTAVMVMAVTWFDLRLNVLLVATIKVLVGVSVFCLVSLLLLKKDVVKLYRDSKVIL